MDIDPKTADSPNTASRSASCARRCHEWLISAKPSRVINLAYFLGSDPPRGRFAPCRRPLDWRSVTLRRRR